MKTTMTAQPDRPTRAEELVAEARELDAKATPGPWEHGPPPAHRYAYTQTSVRRLGRVIAELPLPANDADGEMMARGRSLVPALADELEASLARERSVQATSEHMAADVIDLVAELDGVSSERNSLDGKVEHLERVLAALVSAHEAEDGPALNAALDAAKAFTRTSTPEGAPPP